MCGEAFFTFWYRSVEDPLPGFGSFAPSMLDTSFSIFCSGCPAVFFGPAAFFCFLALGGVLDSKVSSCSDVRSSSDTSSSELGLGRFFEAAGFRVVCVAFFGAALALAAAAFFGAALGFAFCDTFTLVNGRSLDDFGVTDNW